MKYLKETNIMKEKVPNCIKGRTQGIKTNRESNTELEDKNRDIKFILKKWRCIHFKKKILEPFDIKNSLKGRTENWEGKQ